MRNKIQTIAPEPDKDVYWLGVCNMEARCKEASSSVITISPKHGKGKAKESKSQSKGKGKAKDQGKGKAKGSVQGKGKAKDQSQGKGKAKASVQGKGKAKDQSQVRGCNVEDLETLPRSKQKCKSDDPDMKGCAAEDQRL